MKINKLKINSYGKLKEKQIEFGNHINIISGKNESGKSTLLNFIKDSFYGISKNKNGKEISNLEKYTPWIGEDFSGKLEYELDNKEKYEIFRDFKKKNPQIFNNNMEDISKSFNIDKTKGNEFFYEQTKVDETLFLSTILVSQDEVKLEKQEQNMLIQKIANMVDTGQKNISFKKAIEKIDKRRLDEIGTDRSREKPINIINRNIERLESEKNELEKYQDVKYEIEENKNKLNEEINNLENENEFLKEIKLINDNEKIENEKIKLKLDLKNENDKKISSIKDQIKEINLNNKNVYVEEKRIELKKKNLSKKMIIICLGTILINVLQFVLIKNKYFNYAFLVTVPLVLIFYLLLKNRILKDEKSQKNNLENVNKQIDSLNNEIKILERNNIKLEEQINELKNSFILKVNSEKEKVKNKYITKIEKSKLNNLINLGNNNLEIQNMQNKLNNKKIQLHTLELDYKNIEPKLENLSEIEEELFDNLQKKETLEKLDKSMNVAKEVLMIAYEEMKNTITPRFTQELSKTISEITGGKYQNVRFNEDVGLIVETENGNYMPISRLSIGTIDQLYLSLRLSMAEEISTETMPIILDEAFSYYDTDRLKNILVYLKQKFSNHQILIFTCSDREQTILKDLNIQFNLIEM